MPLNKETETETKPSQSGPGVMAIEWYSITGASPSDCLLSYLGHSLERSLTPLQR